MLLKLYQKHIFPHVLNQVMQTPSLMDLRRELLLPVQGDVLEIGFGTGLNLAFYQQVDTVYALEPNADVFALAVPRLGSCPFYVEHIAAHAEALPFADATLQHVVSTWTLCSVADLALVLSEVYRVLQPGGYFHVLEHVLNRQQLNVQRLQQLLTPIQKRLADGCHLNRDIELALLEAGFELPKVRYIDAAGIPKIAQQMLLTHARKPMSAT